MRFLSSVRKEFLEITHDRTMMIVLLIFPVFVMIFMGSSFHSMSINGLPIGVTGQTNSSFTNPLFSQLNNSSAFNLRSYDNEEEAMNAFRNGQLRAVIVVPDDFDKKILHGNGSTIRIVVDNSDLVLEQSIVAAMSAVIEASSANITRTYVSGAWRELSDLNSSATALAAQINESRSQMHDTKGRISQIREGIDNISVQNIENSIDSASDSIGSIRLMIAEQKDELANDSMTNQELYNRTQRFVQNASYALTQSEQTVDSTHAKLKNQTVQLNMTITTLDASIAGLEAIKANESDPNIKAALDLNIASLNALKNSTQTQLTDAQNQMTDLENLNDTLNGFGVQLNDYSGQLDDFSAGLNKTAQFSEMLDNVSSTLGSLNDSFAGAKSEVSKLKTLLSGIKNTTADIDATLDSALNQTDTVDNLINSLHQTVAEQTSKDPNIIASPLAVKVENQYKRDSFVDFIIPQVISVSLLLSCFFLGSISFVREKIRNTVIRALMIPGALENLVIGKIITLVILSFAQIGIILAVAMLLFGVKPPVDIGVLILGTAIAALVLTSIGVLVGFFSKTESAAIQSCLLLAIPMLFLGNIIFSPDLLPNYTQILQQLLPLAHITNIFKIVLITNGNPMLDISALLTYFVALAGLLAFFVLKRRDITNYT